MRPAWLSMLLFAVLALPGAAATQDSPRFRYRLGQVLVAIEQVVQRELDERTGYSRCVSHQVERRYTVLGVDERGDAEVLVEEDHGPQRLLEYTVRGGDARAEHLAERFDPQQTVRRRVLKSRFTPTRFRCEPSRDEAPVYYLQELSEIAVHALQLPAAPAASFEVRPDLTRLGVGFDMRQESAEQLRGSVSLAIRDPRLQGGETVPCRGGRLEWRFDPQRGLPSSWRLEFGYPRYPVGRPNQQICAGELLESAPLDAAALTALRGDYAAYGTLREDFLAGRFAAAGAGAARFLEERATSRLRDAVQAELDSFARQVPRFGEQPPELRPAADFGLPATLSPAAAAGLLADLRGKVVVLDFWATWCTPCIAGMEHLIALQEELGSDGLQVLGLTREDSRQKIADVAAFHDGGYAAKHDGLEVNYPLLVLEDSAVHNWFAIRAIPKLVVLGRDGRVLWEQTGGGGVARLRRIVAAALQDD